VEVDRKGAVLRKMPRCEREITRVEVVRVGVNGCAPVGFNGCASVGASDERLHDYVLKKLADGVKNKAERKDGQCCGVNSWRFLSFALT